jgi:hypothetical protein
VNCVEGGEQSERVEKTKKGSYVLRKKGKSHMTYGAKLSDAVLYEEKQETFPTPRAQEPGRTTEGYGRGLAELMEGKTQKKPQEIFPTPTTQEVEHPDMKLTKTGRRKTKDGKNSHSLNLADTVQKFPTPQSRDYKGPSGRSMKGQEKDLPSVVEKFPTPTARDYKGARKLETLKKKGRNPKTNSLPDSVEGKHIGRLNPTFVEWLMGFPLGWTELKV